MTSGIRAKFLPLSSAPHARTCRRARWNSSMPKRRMPCRAAAMCLPSVGATVQCQARCPTAQVHSVPSHHDDDRLASTSSHAQSCAPQQVLGTSVSRPRTPSSPQRWFMALPLRSRCRASMPRHATKASRATPSSGRSCPATTILPPSRLAFDGALHA